MSRGGKKSNAQKSVRKIAIFKFRQCTYCILLIILSSIFAVGFSFHFYNSMEDSRTLKLKRDIDRTRLLVNTDDELRTNIAKITSIISSYNPDMALKRQEVIAREIYDMSIKYDNLDTELICATITHESARTWDTTIVSKAGAIGLMQIMPTTGAYLAELEGIPWTNAKSVLYDPIYNIRLGCRYLSALIESYEIDGGLAAYNGGLKRVELWLANNRNNKVLWEETQNYIPAVLKYYDEFRGY